MLGADVRWVDRVAAQPLLSILCRIVIVDMEVGVMAAPGLSRAPLVAGPCIVGCRGDGDQAVFIGAPVFFGAYGV